MELVYYVPKLSSVNWNEGMTHLVGLIFGGLVLVILLKIIFYVGFKEVDKKENVQKEFELRLERRKSYIEKCEEEFEKYGFASSKTVRTTENKYELAIDYESERITIIDPDTEWHGMFNFSDIECVYAEKEGDFDRIFYFSRSSKKLNEPIIDQITYYLLNSSAVRNRDLRSANIFDQRTGKERDKSYHRIMIYISIKGYDRPISLKIYETPKELYDTHPENVKSHFRMIGRFDYPQKHLLEVWDIVFLFRAPLQMFARYDYPMYDHKYIQVGPDIKDMQKVPLSKREIELTRDKYLAIFPTFSLMSREEREEWDAL